MGTKIYLTNKKFGRLKVLRESKKRIGGSIYWICKCDCGKIKEVNSQHLRKGKIKSCGCLHKEFISNLNRKHGYYKRGEYHTLEAIKQRCNNSNNIKFKYYGGRGIMICERWMMFENFLADMGERPEGYEIHRIDNSKGYYLNNCEWKEKSKHISDHRRRIL